MSGTAAATRPTDRVNDLTDYRVYDTVADMQATPTIILMYSPRAFVLGTLAVGDGGAAFWFYDPTLIFDDIGILDQTPGQIGSDEGDGTWSRIPLDADGISLTDVVLTTGSYSDPAWLTGLNVTKLIGTIDDSHLSANVLLITSNLPAGQLHYSPRDLSGSATLADTDSVVNATGTISLALPGAPLNGKVIRVFNRGTGSITVSGNGHNINGVSTYLLTRQYETAQFAYDASTTEWNVWP